MIIQIARNRLSLALLLTIFSTHGIILSQTTTTWDGGTNGNGTSWLTGSNWVGDGQPPNAVNSNVLINNRNNPGTINSMSISGTRTLGLITFDNSNTVLASTLNIDTNGSGGTTNQTLTLHSGITLQNTTTTVAFRGSNAELSVVLGAENVFSTSSGSYLQFNSTVAISGGFGVTLAGLGTVGLNAQNTYIGGTTVQSGATLRLGASTQGNSSSSTVSGGVLVSGQIGTGVLNLQDGSTLVSGGTGQRSLQNNLTMNGSVTFGAISTYTGALVFNSSIGAAVGETLSAPATITLIGDTTVTNHVTTSLFNTMGGDFSLTKLGQGILRVSATNTYSGGTQVNTGTLEFGRTGSLGSGTVTLGSSGGGDASLLNYLGGWTLSNNIVVAAGSGGTLTLGYTSLASFSGIFEGSITMNDNLTLRSDAVDGFSMRITGAISGTNNLTKIGPGMVRIEANNTGYSGTTTINEGTLQLGSFAGSASGALGNGEIINNATLRINRSNAFAVSNLISGSGMVTQTGAGTTTLNNANTYAGGTTVTSGSLLVANTSGSATGTGSLMTSAATTFGGTGTVAPTGTNSVSFSGTVSPGASGSAGTLTFKPVDGDVTFQSGSNVAFELYGNGSNDRIDFQASGSGKLDFAAMTAGSLMVTFAGGYTPALNDIFDLLDWAALSGSGINGLSESQLILSTAGFDPSWTWDTTQFVASGVIRVVLVPEPTRFLLLLVSLGMGCLRRRR